MDVHQRMAASWSTSSHNDTYMQHMASISNEEPGYRLEWRRVVSRSMQVPPMKSNSAGASIEGDLWIFGGKGATQFNEIWRYSTSSSQWEPVSIKGNDAPLPRDGHSLTKISPSKFIVYGGQGNMLDTGVRERGTANGKVKYLSMRSLYDDMYEFDCETLSWTFLPRRKVRPLARRGHSLKYIKPGIPLKGTNNATYDENQSKLGYLLLFGGSCLDTQTGFDRATNDLWLYCLATRTWTEVICDGILPHPVYGHCAEVVDSWLVVIGGNIVPQKQTCSVMPITTSNIDNESSGFDCSSSNISPFDLGQNKISVLNLATMCWTHVTVDNTSDFNSGHSISGLKIVGHSMLLSPFNNNEVLIFGGRCVDEVGMCTYTKNDFVPATLLKLNLDTMKLAKVEIANSCLDEANIPEARINQVCIPAIDSPLQLLAQEEKSVLRKGTITRRNPNFTSRRARMSTRVVLHVYGGTKLYSPGFCSGSVYELVFVPYNNKEASKAEVGGDEKKERNRVGSHYLCGSPSKDLRRSRKKSTLEIELESKNDRSNGEVYHMLKLKEDSSVTLLSPKRGLHGQYFQLKACLSRSRSTFTRPDTARNPILSDLNMSLPSLQRRPVSAPSTSGVVSEGSTINSVQGGAELDTTESVSESLMSKEQLMERQRQQKIKQMSSVLYPVTKGMPIHDARCVFNELFPPPNSPRPFVP